MFGVSEHISPELGSFLYKPRSSLYPCERELVCDIHDI